MAATLGYYNPFRYRGYVWDEETWMYYLRSRYYYPELQRFIGEDHFLGARGRLLSHNSYTYGNNTPVISSDFDGNESEISYLKLSGNKFGNNLLGPTSKMTNDD